MIINGKERHFALTVGAYFKIARFCPERDISRLGDLLLDNARSMGAVVKMAVAMNEAYNDQIKWQGFEPEGDSLTEAELLTLPIGDFKILTDEVMAAYKIDQSTEIEVKESKKKGPAKQY